MARTKQSMKEIRERTRDLKRKEHRHKKPTGKDTRSIFYTPLMPVFQMKWTLLAPLTAFTSRHMALIINGLPTTIRERCEALCRYNIPEYAKTTQTVHNFLLSRCIRPIPWALPWTFFDEIQKNLYIEMGVRWAMRRLLHRFRLRRLKGPDHEIDPITFSPIVTPILVHDMKLRRKFLFDAKPLVKHIHTCLYTQEQMVPCAKAPFNIITNRPFTYAQLLSITNQVIHARVPSGPLLPYRGYQFELNTWKTYRASHLLIEAIKEETFNHVSVVGREMLIEFFLSRLHELRIVTLPEFELFLLDGLEWFPGHPSAQILRRLCIQYYEAKILKINVQPILLHAIRTFFLKDIMNGDLWKQVQGRRLEG